VICEWASLIATGVFSGFKCLCVCVPRYVGCSVVCNRSLCDLFVEVCFLICSGFNLLSVIFSF
jgi:hypothetical protein